MLIGLASGSILASHVREVSPAEPLVLAAAVTVILLIVLIGDLAPPLAGGAGGSRGLPAERLSPSRSGGHLGRS